MAVENGIRVMWNGTVRRLPLKQKLHAAVTAGCQVLSVAPSDYVKWLATSVSTCDILSMTADMGVSMTHLDPFVRWVDDWRPVRPIEHIPTDWIAFDEDDFFRMAQALLATSMTAWAAFPKGRYELPAIIDAFGALCHRAKREGLRCDLEFIPMSGVPDLRTGWAIVDGVGAGNSGLVFDLWHYMRSGRDDELLRSIPGEKIAAVQLCDATADLPSGLSLMEDGLNNRQAPGNGAFPIDEIVACLRASGGLNNVGLEVFSPRFDAMSAEAVGQLSRRTFERYAIPQHSSATVSDSSRH